MSSEHQHHDASKDEQFACLLEKVFESPAIDPKFAASLGKDLETVFGQLQLQRDSFPATVKLSDVRGGKRFRWTWVLAAAASVAIVMGIFNSRPNYSWSQMIEALRSQPWVQADTQKTGGAKVVRWVSPVNGVTAEQFGNDAMLANPAEGVVLRYRSSAGAIVKTPLVNRSPNDDLSRQDQLPRQLATLLLPDADPDSQAFNDITVVDQQWQRSDDNKLVELRVSLRIGGDQSRLVQAVFTLNPKTHLPLACKIIENHASSSQTQFTYPDQGPQTIYSLGVPKETQVVTTVTSGSTETLVTTDKPADINPPLPSEPEEPEASSVPAVSAPVVPIVGPPLSEEELIARIDGLLQDKWNKTGIQAAEPATDEEFLRRVSLDLVGHVPSVGEVRMFLEDPAEGCRQRLVESLLRSRDHATYFAGLWRRILIPEGVDLARYGGGARLDEWLADHFQKNTSYDQLVSELLLAEGRIGQSGPLLFYAALKLNPEDLAARTSRVFLGMRMECAQCHNHPFDDRISQKDFWSFAALFARISRPQGKIEMVSPVMQVRDNQRGEVTLPNSDTVVPPRLPWSEQIVSDAEDAPSRREQLVTWLRAPENQQFATATVNRVWAHLFGRGLVEPVDDIRPQNPCVSPELLQLLSQDFIQSKFDLRRLVHCLVSTKAYQLSSRSDLEDTSRTAVFAQMNLKPFTAEQLYDCIAVAAPTSAFASVERGQVELFRFGNTSREAFIELFHVPAGRAVDYQAGIPQALTLMHGQLIHNATDWKTSGAMKSLSAPFFTDQERVETLFLATLSRMPTPEERRQMIDYVGQAENREDRQQRLGDVLWVLLNTAEFTLNH